MVRLRWKHQTAWLSLILHNGSPVTNSQAGPLNMELARLGKSGLIHQPFTGSQTIKFHAKLPLTGVVWPPLTWNWILDQEVTSNTSKAHESNKGYFQHYCSALNLHWPYLASCKQLTFTVRRFGRPVFTSTPYQGTKLNLLLLWSVTLFEAAVHRPMYPLLPG